MTEREQIAEEIREELRQEMTRAMVGRFRQDQQRKLENYRQQNTYIRKGETLFTGSSLMENFPITEYCLNEGLPVAYNRGIGGYTTDDFLEAADTVLLDPQPRKLFINIGTNDIADRWEGEDWLEHLSRNCRKVCEIIRDCLPDTEVYWMAFYPVNVEVAKAQNGTGLGARTNENVNRANRMTEALAEEFGFHWIDVNDGLKDAEGRLQAEHTRDGIHFDSEAYRTVFERLKPFLKEAPWGAG